MLREVGIALDDSDGSPDDARAPTSHCADAMSAAGRAG